MRVRICLIFHFANSGKILKLMLLNAVIKRS